MWSTDARKSFTATASVSLGFSVLNWIGFTSRGLIGTGEFGTRCGSMFAAGRS